MIKGIGFMIDVSARAGAVAVCVDVSPDTVIHLRLRFGLRVQGL